MAWHHEEFIILFAVHRDSHRPAGTDRRHPNPRKRSRVVSGEHTRKPPSCPRCPRAGCAPELQALKTTSTVQYSSTRSAVCRSTRQPYSRVNLRGRDETAAPCSGRNETKTACQPFTLRYKPISAPSKQYNATHFLLA